jgi:5-methylcytosine-specific restriction endonuclease McrA
MTKSKSVCVNEGCNQPRMNHVYYKNGTKKHRPMCRRCFDAGRGIKSYAEGVTPIKKKFCENRDGRLGVVCKATNLQSFQLDLDHIDEDHENNIPENIQTLCKNCHALKSKQYNDNRKKSTKR